jgi:hypothetical protein
MRNDDSVDIGELKIPVDYFKFTDKQKVSLCNTIIDSMLYIIEKNVEPEFDRMEILDGIIESSIITNLEDENYEVVQVLSDVKTLLTHNE